MYLSRLRLTGFKSFVEPTELHIESGLTGIVGPNGCGKSNLVEALRWVMGESSAKQMRGGEMDDMIFGGTIHRPARNLAEVILSLDNSDRTAPAQFNDSGELDIARRIERGSGSSYRINGREVRARDVQTLFADAASGAKSTALVSQGRIGAIINAKPADRRHLIEEAAGITGLHSRRHEAELRLKAAETNLERLDDVLAALEEQLRGLKRQARQATRYRNLSDHIRRAEAMLLHRRWIEAQAERDAARNRLEAAEKAVEETTRLAAAAAARQGEAAAALPDLRRAEVEAAAALQRLLVARDALDAEERRLEEARSDIHRRRAQIDGDVAREQALESDAAAAVTRLDAEAGELRTAQSREAAELAASQRDLEAVQAEVGGLDEALTRLTGEVAAEETRRAELSRRVGELDGRRSRLGERLEEVGSERRRAVEQAEDGGRLAAASEAVAESRARLDDARARVERAEQALGAAQAAETEGREGHQGAESGAARLRAEHGALSELLRIGESEQWPPMVDAVTVDPGYEVALGIALGDDLTAATDEAAPMHWRSLPAYPDPAPLPGGTRPLSEFVQGPPALIRRISQIGVVEDEATGDALGRDLVQGQRLVSRSGALWRWDGLTAAAGAPTAAATRLSQRNRFGELRAILDDAERHAAAAKQRFERLAAAARQAGEQEKQARAALWAANNAANEARDAEAALAQSTADARSRIQTLEEARSGLSADLADLEAQIGSAQGELGALPDLAKRRDEIHRSQIGLGQRRKILAERQSGHDRLLRDADARRFRLEVIDSDLASWRDRAERAVRQLDELAERRRQADGELERLEARPAEIASQRSALLDQIGSAEKTRDAAADGLAEAETRLEGIARELRQTEARLADEREERVRRQAAVEQIDQTLATIAERIREKLGCAPDEALAAAGIAEDQELPELEKIETRLERLLRERENMGPVNLRAESEAAELDDRIEAMRSEREDLIGAISRLRQGISGLNREGRQRLLAAFGEVDRHFRDLFARLFGGGNAHLSLTEAEDPFEAGLEVMASPPGKKLQTMSLLSGGEQALAALALLFAVFLTNPAPICVLDEVDAPLDDHNVDRFCTLLSEIAHSSSTRFLLVTHHRLTMARMDRLYGVTMAEHGVSQLVSVDLQTAEEMRETA